MIHNTCRSAGFIENIRTAAKVAACGAYKNLFDMRTVRVGCGGCSFPLVLWLATRRYVNTRKVRISSRVISRAHISLSVTLEEEELLQFFRSINLNMELIYKTVDGQVGKKLDWMFGVKSSFMRVEPGHCLLPPNYVFLGTKIRDMEIRNDDIWMVSYPRTGRIAHKIPL